MNSKTNNKCPKCRTNDFNVCKSISCPMRDEFKTNNINSDWSIEDCFNKMRFDNNYHLGFGDLRITIGTQEEIISLINKFYKKR